MKNLQVFGLATNHPDPVNKYWGVFNQRSIKSIADKGVDIKAIIPRPYSPPFSKYNKIPERGSDDSYPKYYPRFWYLPPKSVFYGFSGESYSKHVTKFLENNLDRPDIVHAFHIYLDGYGVLNYCKKNDLPLVVTSHGDILREYWLKSDIRKRIKPVLDYSSAILCVSDDLADIARSRVDDKEKVKVVPIGVDIEEFRNYNEKSDDDVLRILFVGQFIERKGISTLLKIIKSIRDTDYNISFKLVGFKGDLKNKIEKFIKNNSKNNVELIEECPEEKLKRLYSESDIFLLPSKAEGRPTVIYEAMASECVIISTEVGGIPEQVKEGYNGFLTQPESPEEMVNKILYLYDDREKLKEMCKNSRQRIIENDWTWDGYADRVLKVYDDVLDI